MTTTRLVVGALFIATAPLAAQDKCGPDELVPWWPRFVGPGWKDFTPAERAIVEDNLQAVEAMVQKTNYGTPRGFAVRPSLGYGGPTRDERNWGYGNPTRNPVRWYEYTAIIHHACARHEEFGSGITIQFNPDPQSWSESDRPLLDENGDALYSERARRERQPSTATGWRDGRCAGRGGRRASRSWRSPPARRGRARR